MLRALAAAALLVAAAGSAGAEPAPPVVEIAVGAGTEAPRKGVRLETEGRIVRAAIAISVEKAAAAGVVAFALRLDFGNGTSARAALEEVSAFGGVRRRQLRWGGIVDGRGGVGYSRDEDRVDLDKIQDPPEAQQVATYPWRERVPYELLVERGKQVTLPPGWYTLVPGHAAVEIQHARTLWQWRVTLRPVAHPGDDNLVATLYAAGDAIARISLANEAAGEAMPSALRAVWSHPVYGTLDEPDEDLAVTRWKRQ